MVNVCAGPDGTGTIAKVNVILADSDRIVRRNVIVISVMRLHVMRSMVDASVNCRGEVSNTTIRKLNS